MFYNKSSFLLPIKGKVVNKIAKGKQAYNYPRFTSYSKNVELKEIFENIDYRGGYMMQGNKFIADGGKYAEATIVFKALVFSSIEKILLKTLVSPFCNFVSFTSVVDKNC